jgi:hypothetical protein
LDWQGELLAGRYELTWGAEGYGWATEPFEIKEKDGRLYLRDHVLATPEATEPAAQVPDALVEEAVLDLTRRVDVDQEDVTVEAVQPFDFSDASLGVTEPGRSYAQVVTPGYVIRLRVGDELFAYHGAGERVVLVPWDEGEDDQGRSLDEMISYQNVTVAEAGLRIEAPTAWERLVPEYAWTPESGSSLRMGVSWSVLKPPMEPEAVFLPNHAAIVTSEPIGLGWAEGRRFTLEVFAPAADGGDGRAPVEMVEEHVLVMLDTDEGRLGLDFYASAPSTDELAELAAPFNHLLETAVPVAPAVDVLPTPDRDGMSDWKVIVDESYGFEFMIPNDWTYQEMTTDGPGVPEDWPLERGIALFPEAWADRFEEKDGPPDPSAPPAVPAMMVEVYVGPLTEVRRAFPEPTRKETLEVNGVQAVREVDSVGDEIELVRYVFRDPGSEDVRIVITDNYSGFPDRRAATPEVADLNRLVVATFAFSD